MLGYVPVFLTIVSLFAGISLPHHYRVFPAECAEFSPSPFPCRPLVQFSSCAVNESLQAAGRRTVGHGVVLTLSDGGRPARRTVQLIAGAAGGRSRRHFLVSSTCLSVNNASAQ